MKKNSFDSLNIFQISVNLIRFSWTKSMLLDQLWIQLACLSQFTFEIKHVAGEKNELPDSLSRFTSFLGDYIEKKEKLSDKKIQDLLKSDVKNASAFDSKDTGNKEITEEDHKQLRKIKMQSHAYKKNQNVSIINSIIHAKPNQSRHEHIKREHNCMFNSICREFKHKANYLEKQKISEFVSQGDKTIISDENAFNTKPCINFIEKLQETTKTIHKLDKTSINTLDVIFTSLLANETQYIKPDPLTCGEYDLNIISEAVSEDTGRIEEDLNQQIMC